MGLSAEMAEGIFNAQAAFLDLHKVDIPAAAGLVNTGPSGCLSGHLQLVQGQLRMSSQVYS